MGEIEQLRKDKIELEKDIKIILTRFLKKYPEFECGIKTEYVRSKFSSGVSSKVTVDIYLA